MRPISSCEPGFTGYQILFLSCTNYQRHWSLARLKLVGICIKCWDLIITRELWCEPTGLQKFRMDLSSYSGPDDVISCTYTILCQQCCVSELGGGGGRIIASENPAHSSHCHLRLTHVTCACSTLEAFASRARLLVLEAPLFFSSKYFVFVFRTDNARALDSLQYLFISARKKRHKFCTPRLWKWFL